MRQYDAFCVLLDAELGLQPTGALRQRLVTGVGTGTSTGTGGTAAKRLRSAL
jgi:hypothetical protein